MEHLVRFKTAEGREGQHQTEGLDEALRFVERLRNTEATPEVRVYRMQEVPIEFRTYYKVELASPESGEVGAPVEAEPVEAAREDLPRPLLPAGKETARPSSDARGHRPVVMGAEPSARSPLAGGADGADGGGRRRFGR